MAIICLGQQFPAGILNGNKGLDGRTRISAYPADTLIGGIEDTLVGYGNNLPVVRDQVTESTATAAGITGNPGDAAVGRVFDAVIGRVDSDQLTAEGYQLWHVLSIDYRS